MAKLNFLKRLVKEDFQKDDQALIEKIATILNPALEAITSAFNKDLTFQDNINCQIKDFEVVLKASGEPKATTTFKSELSGSCKGLICIKATNTESTTQFPTSQPFITFAENNGQIEIAHVSGLQTGVKYKLRVLAVG
jgi:hypothetical protein